MSRIIYWITVVVTLMSLPFTTSQQNINIIVIVDDSKISTSRTNHFLMQIVAENDHVAVMFYEKGDERSEK